MKTRHLFLILAILIGMAAEALAQEPEDSDLYRQIQELDALYFDAYNRCDLQTQANLLHDEVEFYHDMGGLSTDKAAIVESIRRNICGKVRRELVTGSLEVHEIAGFGAVSLGYHTFYNHEEPNAPSKPSRFVTVWKQEQDTWHMYRIISLH